jgi:Alcohol dehydrogenase GroES-associated
MKAVRYHGPQDIRIENIEEPVAKDGQVKIKVSCWSLNASVAVDRFRLLGTFLFESKLYCTIHPA